MQIRTFLNYISKLWTSIQFLNDLILFFGILHDIMIEKHGPGSGLLILFLKKTIFKIVHYLLYKLNIYCIYISLYKYNIVYLIFIHEIKMYSIIISTL